MNFLVVNKSDKMGLRMTLTGMYIFICVMKYSLSFSEDYILQRIESIEKRFNSENELRKMETMELRRKLVETGNQNGTITKEVQIEQPIISNLTLKEIQESTLKLQELKTALLRWKASEKMETVRIQALFQKTREDLKSEYREFVEETRKEIKGFTDAVQQELTDVRNQLNATNKTIESECKRLELGAEERMDIYKKKFNNQLEALSANVTSIKDNLPDLELVVNRIREDSSSENDGVALSLGSLRKEVSRLSQLFPVSCLNTTDGLRNIYPNTLPTGIKVYCDQTTDGGGWIMFQRRQDGSVEFRRNWTEYKDGFGDLIGEFWLGNDNLHSLTAAGFNELRIDMEDFEGNKAHAKYSYFKVGSEDVNYSIDVRGYSGDTGDSLEYHNGMSFTTKDRDNDEWMFVNCAEIHSGAWWYNDCLDSNLNGVYFKGADSPYGRGVIWTTWKGMEYSLKLVEMKVR